MKLAFDEARLLEFAKTVELASTKVLEGLHRSPRGGEGIEFHSAVPYSEGEDARRIDWKRYAASDRYYINKYKREEKTAWNVLLDNSSSMNYGEKSHWSRLWAASFVFLAKAWGDKWMLYPDLEFALDEAFEALAGGASVGCSPREFDQVATDLHGRLIMISDGFFPEDYLVRDLRTWAGEFSSVYLIQVLDPREAGFEFEGVLQFEDMESTERLTMDTRVAKKRYLEEYQKHQEFLEESLKNKGFLYTSVVGARPFEAQLMEFFEKL